MDTGLVVVRLLHILLGVFWAGAVLFFVVFLEPSLREAGSGGRSVAEALKRRGYLTALPVAALLTILTGVDLLRRVSGNFAPEWFGSGPGRVITVGSLSAVVAFLAGIIVLRPGMLRLGRLAGEVEAATDAGTRQARLAELERVRRRTTVMSRVIALLLTVAVAAMAVARYVG